ncbi:MAG: DUF481 domain-containing protein [Bacteroidota bacterium]
MKNILYLLLFSPLLLTAQINESDTLNFKADLALSGIWQRGNVQTSIFRAKSNISFKPWSSAVFKTTNSYVYQGFGKQKADEDILSLNFLYFHPQRKVYPLVLGFVSTNFRREIDLRYLLGVGVTYQVFKKNNNWLKFSLSSEYEQTDFARSNFNLTEYNGESSIHTFRGTLWINGKYHLFDNKLIFGHESYYQPSLERGNNYRWRADLSLELPVWEFLNFTINYTNTFESIVIENQQQEDYFLTFGFSVKSY